MSTKLCNVLMFAAGIAIGSVVTWKMVKTKYEQIAQEEINSVKEHFNKKNREADQKMMDVMKDFKNTLIEHKDDKPEEFRTGLNNTKPDLAEYAKLVAKKGYTNYANPEVLCYEEPKELEDYEDFDDFDDNDEEEEDNYESRNIRELDKIEKAILKERGETVEESEPVDISADEYGEIDDYDLVSLNYYSDGVLTDDWDNEIGDAKSLVGSSFMNNFDDNGIAYVRNDENETYYEIVRDDNPFSSIKDRPPCLVDD